MLKQSQYDDVAELKMPVSKELFLLVIQDSSVQKLMDDLDIPPDRASLFDVLDADGSGGLEVTELIQGLLRVRGEAKKSDVVGSLLAVRAVQGMIRELQIAADSISEDTATVRRHLLTHSMSRRSDRSQAGERAGLSVKAK